MSSETFIVGCDNRRDNYENGFCDDVVNDLSNSAPGPVNAKPTLAERLGFKATDKLLIVNVDDVGGSHAANAAAIDALENGLATSATIMVPCPWFPEIAAYAKARPQSDFGLHLAHTSEWRGYKRGPVASRNEVPGLVDPQGYLWPDIFSVYKNSSPEQAYIEARAQIQKALAAGVDVTHLDSHMGALQYDDRYFQVYRRLAKEFDLPLRMGSQEVLAAGRRGPPARAARLGRHSLSRLLDSRRAKGGRAYKALLEAYVARFEARRHGALYSCGSSR